MSDLIAKPYSVIYKSLQCAVSTTVYQPISALEIIKYITRQFTVSTVYFYFKFKQVLRYVT